MRFYTTAVTILICFYVNAQELAQQEKDSLSKVIEEHKARYQIYKKDLAENPEKTRDSVRNAQQKINASRGRRNLEALTSNTRLDTLKKINLSNAGLKEIPSQVYEAKNVEMLILDYNQIKRLPRQLSALKKLKLISWSNNGLQSFRWIRIAKLDQIQSLNLSDNGLKRVPSGIRKLNNLKILVLDRNSFEKFPVNRIAKAKSVKKLALSKNSMLKITKAPYHKLDFIEELIVNHCELASFHPSFYQMSGLVELQFQGNKLTRIPEGIPSLSNLKRLSFYKNELVELPRDIFDLEDLLVIDLYYNRLKLIPEIPDDSNLEVLYLSYNELYDISPSIGRIKNLEKIYLHHNKLSVLPEEIGQLKKLKVMRTNDNFLVDFPNQVLSLKDLEDFDISNNSISTIPVGISDLEQLKLFSYHGNEIDFDAEENDQLIDVLKQMNENGVICSPRITEVQ